LPFPRAAFEDAIRAGGKGVEASLRAFNAGFDAAKNGEPNPEDEEWIPPPEIEGPDDLLDLWIPMIHRVDDFPQSVRGLAHAGLRKTVDFQDAGYGTAYLDHLEKVQILDSAAQGWALTVAAAKHIANAMAYDDIIRVADLKTRVPRMDRITNEMGATEDQLIQLTEFFHPRAEEIASLMPAKMGAAWEASPKRMALLARLFSKGHRLRTHTLRSFLMLHFLGGLKNYRLRTRRHAVEQAHLDAWLDTSLAMVPTDYALAVELLNNRRLIKGYSDTHTRGLSKFATVMGAADLLKGRKDAAEWMVRLREAALQDPEGKALEGALKTVRSFV
jgi:indolepyruvate ferredoxin oxidoreductase beta subunit